MKKKVIVVLLFVCLLTGCNFNSYLYVGQQEKTSSTSWSMTYQKFSGHEARDIEVEDVSIPFTVDIDTKEGTFTLTLLQDDQEIHVFSESDKFIINEPGTYTLRMDGDDHKGGFQAQWG